MFIPLLCLWAHSFGEKLYISTCVCMQWGWHFLVVYSFHLSVCISTNSHAGQVAADVWEIPSDAKQIESHQEIQNQYPGLTISCWRNTSYFLGEYTSCPGYWPLFFFRNTSLLREFSLSNTLICTPNQAEPSLKCMWI